MAEQTPPPSHSALTRDSNRSSHSRVVGGRRSRQLQNEIETRGRKRSATSPSNPSSDSVRRCSRRSTNADNSPSTFTPKREDLRRHRRKKLKRDSSCSVPEDCVARCTRSQTALRLSESACELRAKVRAPDERLNRTADAPLPSLTNRAEGGFLPFDERDFAYSPFSSSTITDFIDSDYSVYTPTSVRNKGKKRKRSSPKSKRSLLKHLEFEEKRVKIESESSSSKGPRVSWRRRSSQRSGSEGCSYPLRSRPVRHDTSPYTTSAAVRDTSASSTASEASSQNQENEINLSRSRIRKSSSPPRPKLSQEVACSSRGRSSPRSKLPADLPYLRQTNARRSIAAASSGNLGACLTRGSGASQQQRRDQSSSKRQQVSSTEGGATGSAAGGRRARARDMPQPPHASTRRDKRGKSSLGSCASSGGVAGRPHPPPLTTGAVASTSSTQPAPGSAASMPEVQPVDAKPKAKVKSSNVESGGWSAASSSSAEECGSGAGGGGGAEESSSEEGEVGRLQALLEARGLPPHLLGALGPRMQHLLHRTVGSNTAASKAAQLLSGLQATGDEGQQLQAVIEMCQLLVMGNEDTLAGFPVRQVVPALINLLAMEHNFDMMNHACRALTYMLEALPRSSGAVALAVPSFLDKLQAITCMDVAEQSLTALDMLSRRHSKTILQARGVAACLTYLDFFSINAQRAALSITANCCQNLTGDEFHYVRDSLQLLANRLTQQDKKSVECVCLAFSRLVDSYQHDPARLQEIATPHLLTNLQQLLVVSPPLISAGTFITVLRLLWVMCAACPALALALHRRSIADTLLALLTGSSVPAQHHQVDLIARSPQELYEITCLIGELMPRLPADGIFAVDAYLDRPWAAAPQDRTVQWQWRDDRGVWRAYSWAECRALEAGGAAGEEEVCLATLGRSYTVDLGAMQQVNDHTGTARPVQRVAPPSVSPQAAAQNNQDPRISMVRGSGASLVRSLLAVLHEVYWSSAGPAVRAQALKAILRMVYYAEPQLLQEVLKVQVISSHIAGMMASNDLRIVVGSLQLAEILMQRLPEEFGVQFRREGVLHQISQLADPTVPLSASPPKHTPSPVAPTHNTRAKNKSSVPGSASATPVRASGPSGGASPAASTSAASLDHPHLALAFSTTSTFMSAAVSGASTESAASAEPGPAPPSTSQPAHSHSPALHRSGSPLQLAEMLKRKRAVKRSAVAQPRHARRARDEPSATPHSPPHPAQATPQHGSSTSTAHRAPSRGFTAAKTTSFLSSLHPSRWGRTLHAAAHKDGALLGAAPHASPQPNLTSLNKEKVREWIRATASRLEREWGSAGGGEGALERLASLAEALPHAALHRTALTQLRDTLAQHDVSPFEVNHSGVIGALLRYLTENKSEGAETEGEALAPRDERLRLFLNVFADMPLTAECTEWSDVMWSGHAESGALAVLVAKVNACVSQLEQFLVRVHDLPARPATSALKFFNTHQLMCDLKRHPNCTNLKQWKGGVVRIDPLALVQAIERYLAQRGYATARPRDGSAAAPHSDDDNGSDDDVEDTLAAPAQPATQQEADHKLEFVMGETVLPYNMTVYQAVRQYGDQVDTDTDTETPLGNAGIWVHTHTIYYRAVDSSDGSRQDAAAALGRKGKGQPTKASSRRKPDQLWNEGTVAPRESVLDSLLVTALLPAGADVEDASLPALSLLRALHALSRHWPALYRACCLHDQRPLLPQHHFVNAKLAAKANRQLQDPLVIMTGNLPNWLRRIAYACPFVLPFECRHLLFYVVSFDRDRALQRLMEAGGERGGAGGGAGGAGGAPASDASERVAPRLDRRKRTVQRQSVLRQAEHVMHEFAHSKALLEIQYENEVGTGLGPTLEFYALVSQELQRADLDLWHGSENFKQKPSSFGGDIVKSSAGVVSEGSGVDAASLASSVRDALSLHDERAAESSELEKETSVPTPGPDATFVSWPCGLYPAALGRNARTLHLSRLKTKFRFLGKFMAKAVMDSRMVDIPLSVTFYRWLVGEARQLWLGDVRGVAPELWRSLCRLQEVAERARRLHRDSRHTPEQRRELIGALELDGCPIEELGLDFILPGDHCTELRRGGRDMPVTAHNLHQYIALVTHWLLYEGVNRQMEAFREGFESVFPLNNLKMFYPEELELIFCGSPSGGREQRWDPRMLAECIRPDHGFNAESRAIRMLVDILASYNREEQRLFLQFVTGSPRLPTGGFKALNPPLTVVRKSLESSLEPDEYLPSVMTCVNYLKLPDYSSAEAMRAKLRLAASEGQHSFHLS